MVWYDILGGFCGVHDSFSWGTKEKAPKGLIQIWFPHFFHNFQSGVKF